jgi:hypothetical protein
LKNNGLGYFTHVRGGKRFQFFTTADGQVAALNNGARRKDGVAGGDDHVPQTIHARGGNLQHQHVRIAIDHQARQAIRLAKHYAVAGSGCAVAIAHELAALVGGADLGRQPRLVNCDVTEGQQAHANRSIGGIGARANNAAVAVGDGYEVAMLHLWRNRLQRAGKNPGVVKARRRLAPGFKGDGGVRHS